jgi:hypothetical protein
MEVHKFDVGLTGDKPFIGAQAGRQSPDEGFGGGVKGDTWDGEFCGERAVEGDEDWVGEGGLAEGGEESAGEKGREERVPPDDGEVIIFRPFLESDGSTGESQYRYEMYERDWALPFGLEVGPANVVDEQRYVQIVKSLRNASEVDGGAGGICDEGLDDSVLPESLDLFHGRLEFLLVPTVDDDIETFAVEVLRQGLSYPIGGTGDNRIGLWTLLILFVLA